MVTADKPGRRTRRRGVRPVLIFVKLLGVAGFLGGLGALLALGALGPEPVDAEGWLDRRDAMRAIFWPCVFGGVVTAIGAGLLLWLRHPAAFLRTRWFRVKVVALAVVVPSLHLLARGRVTRFYEAIDAGRLDELPALHGAVTRAWGIALLVMIAVAALARTKPRLGQPIGARRR